MGSMDRAVDRIQPEPSIQREWTAAAVGKTDVYLPGMEYYSRASRIY